jgi:hypothetical protein
MTMEHSAWYVTIEWNNGSWRGDRVNLGVIVMCPDLQYIDVLLTPNGGREDQRIAAFFDMPSMDPLARNKENIRFRVDRWREHYFVDPHPDKDKRREFIHARLIDEMTKCSIYGSINYRELRLIMVGDDPSVDLRTVYDDDVAWPPKREE